MQNCMHKHRSRVHLCLCTLHLCVLFPCSHNSMNRMFNRVVIAKDFCMATRTKWISLLLDTSSWFRPMYYLVYTSHTGIGCFKCSFCSQRCCFVQCALLVSSYDTHEENRDTGIVAFSLYRKVTRRLLTTSQKLAATMCITGTYFGATSGSVTSLIVSQHRKKRLFIAAEPVKAVVSPVKK